MSTPVKPPASTDDEIAFVRDHGADDVIDYRGRARGADGQCASERRCSWASCAGPWGRCSERCL